MDSPPPPQQPSTPGSSFYPQNHDLLTQYLLPKLAGQPLPAATQRFFFEADVYVDDPETLTSRYQPGPARIFRESPNWYFFCPEKPSIGRDGRKPRIVGGGKGTWKQEKGEMVVDPTDGRHVGRLERFTYTPKPKGEGWKPEWLMVEFSLDQQVGDGGGEPRVVLCKIYRSPHFLNSAAKASSSASACTSNGSARKRKAASLSASARKTLKTTGDSSSSVRRQLVFPSTPALNPVTHEAVLGESSDPLRQQRGLPNLLAVLGGDRSCSELSAPTPKPSPPAPDSPVKEAFTDDNSDSYLLRCPSPPAPTLTAAEEEWMVADDMAPWPCSMTAAPVPFYSGMSFYNSIVAP